MAEEKGVCQIHKVEFILTEGCPLCLDEKRGEFTPESVTEEEAKEIDQHVIEDAAREAKEQTALVTKPGEDTEVKNYYEQALGLQTHAESRVIKTVEDLKSATDDLSLITKIMKAMEAKRKEYLKPYEDKKKAINENYKFWMGPIEAANTITRQKMTAYDMEQRRIRQAQEEINRKRMEAAQEEAALKGGEITESVKLVEVTEASQKVSTDMGTAGMVDSWKYEVFDFALLPDEYKVIDSTVLNTIARKHHDQKPIPGVRFYNEPTLRVNTK